MRQSWRLRGSAQRAGSGPAASALAYIGGSFWVKHLLIMFLLCPFPLAYLGIYLCMGVYLARQFCEYTAPVQMREM